jgi:hypothetical protein
MSGESFEPKRYACIRWPFLRVGSEGIKFNAGFFTANTPEEAAQIEGNEAFGRHIHPVQFKAQPVPSKPGKVETMIEAEIEEALAAKQPQARKGAVGTRNVEFKKK